VGRVWCGACVVWGVYVVVVVCGESVNFFAGFPRVCAGRENFFIEIYDDSREKKKKSRTYLLLLFLHAPLLS
jgi:hypothetical protein